MLIIYRDDEVQNQIVAWGGDHEWCLEGESGYNPLTKATSLIHCLRTGAHVGSVWSNYTYNPS